MWSKNVNEIVSTHGYSQNQIIVWRYPTISKVSRKKGCWLSCWGWTCLSYMFCLNYLLFGYVLTLHCRTLQLATLTGHTFRVLYLAISPDGQVKWLICIWTGLLFKCLQHIKNTISLWNYWWEGSFGKMFILEFPLVFARQSSLELVMRRFDFGQFFHRRSLRTQYETRVYGPSDGPILDKQGSDELVGE